MEYERKTFDIKTMYNALSFDGRKEKKGGVGRCARVGEGGGVGRLEEKKKQINRWRLRDILNY